MKAKEAADKQATERKAELLKAEEAADKQADEAQHLFPMFLPVPF